MAWLRGRSKERATAAYHAAGGVRFPQQDMAALYHRIRSAHTGEGLVIEVMAPHGGAGVTAVANGIGHAAADLAGQRVLLCDATGSGELLRLAGVTRRQNLADLMSASLQPAPGQIVACALDADRSPSHMLAMIDTYAAFLPNLRRAFDLIVIDMPPSGESGLGAAFSRHTDAVVGVVEAEKTRGPTIDIMLRNIEANGGKVAGLVLNKRVRHIPARVYRWL